MSFFDTIYAIVGYPLGWIMWACYQVVHNYGVALIFFTLLTKIILLPLSIKQQKSQVKMALFQPKMQEIQKKYANNREKMNEEMTKLYQKEGYNPMSGCMPLLIQMPILFGLIDVIYKPLYHILRIPKEVITQAVEVAKNVVLTGMGQEAGAKFIAANPGLRQENLIMKGFEMNPDAFISTIGQDFADKITGFDQRFLFWDLSQIPTLALNLLVLIPILSGVTALLVSMVSMKMTRQTSANTPGMGGMNVMMMLMMPLMSAWIAFQVPAGVGLYWALSNLFAMCQTLLLYRLYNPKEMIEKAKVEEEARREEERRERAELRKKMQSGEYQQAEKEKAMKQKELNRDKLAEARRRMAEKYGEEYAEVTDKDLG